MLTTQAAESKLPKDIVNIKKIIKQRMLGIFNTFLLEFQSQTDEEFWANLSQWMPVNELYAGWIS